MFHTSVSPAKAYVNDLDIDLASNTPWVDMSACVKFRLDRPSRLAGHTERTNRHTDKHITFLRATASMLSAHMLSQFRLSVCLSVSLSVCPSVTRVIHAKTVEVRILQFSPYSSPIPLVFAR